MYFLQTMSGTDYDYLYKCVMVGDSGVGKSSLLTRLTENRFSSTSMPTIGVDFGVRRFEVNSKRIKLQMWDCAGNEKWRSVTPTYYRDAHVVILLFDLTSAESFEHVSDWLKEADTHVGRTPPQHLLIGTKADEAKHRRRVDTTKAQDYAKQHDMPYVEVSSKHAESQEAIHKAIVPVLETLVETGVTGYDPTSKLLITSGPGPIRGSRCIPCGIT